MTKVHDGERQGTGRLTSGLKNAVAFVVVGPAIGVAIYGLWGWMLSADKRWASLLGILWLLAVGYILAALPAAITGFLIGLWVQPDRPWRYVGISGLVGGLAAGSVAFLDTTAPSVSERVVNLAVIGALASFGVAGARLVVGAFARHAWPKPSLKAEPPHPHRAGSWGGARIPFLHNQPERAGARSDAPLTQA